MDDQFVMGTAATEGQQRIIYDPTSGSLFFDRDGSGSDFDPMLVALLTNKPTISASDICIVT